MSGAEEKSAALFFCKDFYTCDGNCFFVVFSAPGLTTKNKMLYTKLEKVKKIRIYSDEESGRACGREICMHIAEGARAKTLRQKDWILTGLWKAIRLHRRSNLFYTGNLSGYSYRGTKTIAEDAVIVFVPLFFYINSFFHKH